MLFNRLAPAACGALLLAGCGSLQGPPNFQQAYGIVDEPCAASKAVSHCMAHVLLVNHGGEGVGHATVVVPMKDSAGSASAISTAKCGTAIPNTPAGGYADLTCAFDLPVGKTLATAPSLSAVDYTAAAGPGSGSSVGDISGIGTLALAAAAGLLAIVALVAAIAGRRRRPTGSPRRPAPAPPQPAAGDQESSW